MISIKKLIMNKLGGRVLKTPPELDIMIILNNFIISKELTYYTMRGLIVVDENDIVSHNNEVIFRNIPKEIRIFQYKKETYNILKKVYSNKKIIKVSLGINLKCEPNIILDMEDYTSVRSAYELAKQAGITLSSDKELLDYAVNRMVPKKKLVKLQKYLGKKAFEGSRVAQYKVVCIMC